MSWSEDYKNSFKDLSLSSLNIDFNYILITAIFICQFSDIQVHIYSK